MKTRTLHKILGLTLLLPFIAWSGTAVFFLVRPAYEQAYARLEVRQYPLESQLRIAPGPDWREFRYFRSILGPHLLVRREAGWQHLDPATGREQPYPDNESLRALVSDAITVNTERYGTLSEVDGRRLRTDTGVDIQLDWNTLTFAQEGRDTRWIGRVYSIHYLEWTGIGPIDKFLGLFGLFLLMYITWTGAKLAFGRDKTPAKARSAVRQPLAEAEQA